MTREDALIKAHALIETIKNSMAEFDSLNRSFDLKLSITDDETIYDRFRDEADNLGWSSSYC